MKEYKVTVKGKHGAGVSVAVVATSPEAAGNEALGILGDIGLLPEGPVEIVSVERV